ncbi:MAG: hypothetical protein Q7J48_07410 [Nocardioides sp.]|nr:hypothetical protein [Nocardioides sp.]
MGRPDTEGDSQSTPPGEHESELVDGDDAVDETAPLQEENAATSEDQPSQ